MQTLNVAHRDQGCDYVWRRSGTDQARPHSVRSAQRRYILGDRRLIDLSRKESRPVLDERVGPLAVVCRPNQADSLLALSSQISLMMPSWSASPADRSYCGLRARLIP